MAKSSFTATTGEVKKSSAITLDDLNKITKSPYDNRSPFKHNADAEFEGFAPVSWTSTIQGVKYEGTYMGIKIKGIKDAVSLSTFLKVDEEAVDDSNKFYPMSNDSEGVAKIMAEYEELSLELLQKIEKFFEEKPRKFKLKPYKALTTWGKRQNRNIVNII